VQTRFVPLYMPGASHATKEGTEACIRFGTELSFVESVMIPRCCGLRKGEHFDPSPHGVITAQPGHAGLRFRNPGAG
jgi:hypothetical protein